MSRRGFQGIAGPDGGAPPVALRSPLDDGQLTDVRDDEAVTLCPAPRTEMQRERRVTTSHAHSGTGLDSGERPLDQQVPAGVEAKTLELYRHCQRFMGDSQPR